jgi:hypothetical protein
MRGLIAVLLCIALVAMSLYGLHSFAGYAGRRSALADPPDVLWGPGASRWLALSLIVSVIGTNTCLVACVCVLHVIGGFIK